MIRLGALLAWLALTAALALLAGAPVAASASRAWALLSHGLARLGAWASALASRARG